MWYLFAIDAKSDFLFKMPFTIFLYLFLIDATWDFDLFLPIILDVGKQFKDVSLTNVIASMFSFLFSKYSSCRCWCKAFDFLLGGFRPLLFIMCLLWLRHTWYNQSYILGWGVKQPVPKCLWKFSQPFVVFCGEPSRQPAHIARGNVEFGFR